MFLDVLLAVMIVSLIGVGIFMAKHPTGIKRPCPPHSWTQDSQLNFFCEKCNKMPFEVNRGEGPDTRNMYL